jgi:hypothetical protein
MRTTVNVPVVTVSQKTVGISAFGFADFSALMDLMGSIKNFSHDENDLTIELTKDDCSSTAYSAYLISEGGTDATGRAVRFSIPEGCGVDQWLAIVYTTLDVLLGFAGWKRRSHSRVDHGFHCRYER